MERFLLFVALGVSLAFGQQAPATGTLSGKVLDANTKEGIRKATVYATAGGSNRAQGTVLNFSPPTIYSATTDDSGAFRFAGLATGNYFLRAEKAGFLTKPALRPAMVTVSAGAEATSPDLSMHRQAVISGKVTDAGGEPLEHVNVQVVSVRRSRLTDGQTIGQAMTDDRGEYRIPRLQPGKYRILATKGIPGVVAQSAAANGEPPLVDTPTYYPSTLDESTASEVQVNSGDDRAGVDIRLQKSAAVRVSGRVSGEGAIDQPISVSLQPAGARGSGMNMRGTVAGLEGRFTLLNVTPGEYVLTAHTQKAGAQMTGWTRLRVAQQDLDSIQLPLQPLTSLSGRVVSEGGGKLPPGQINIGFRPVETASPGGAGGTVRPDGTFVIENVQRTRLRLTAMAPRGWYLKSVSVGGQRQPGLEIDLTAGEAPLELLYSNKPGSVSGNVEGPIESPALAYAVTDGGAAGPVLTNLYRTAPVTPDRKTFKIEDVPPGNYLIVVCEPGLLESLGDAAVWEKVKAKAVAVKVEEGATVLAAPRLIVESDLDEK